MSYNLNAAAMGGNLVLSRAGAAVANLALVAAAKTYTTQALTYTVQGKLYYAAGVTAAVAPLVDGVTGKAFLPLQKNQGCAFMWAVNAAGAVVLVQGPTPVTATTVITVTNVDDLGNYSLVPQMPPLPDTFTPFAYMIVRLQSTYAGTGFVAGSSDNWNATGVVASTQDLFSLPAFPQIV